MSAYSDLTRTFHQAMNIPVDAPFEADLLTLRQTLIAEETKELFDEVQQAIKEIRADGHVCAKTHENMMKELADVLFVSFGFAVSFGFPMDEIFKRVYESNMSKLGDDGKPIYRADGKITKSPNYRKPDLSDLVK